MRFTAANTPVMLAGFANLSGARQYASLLFYAGGNNSLGVVADEKDSAGTERYPFAWYGNVNNGTTVPLNTWFFGAAVYSGLSSRLAFLAQAGGVNPTTPVVDTNAVIDSPYSHFTVGSVQSSVGDLAPNTSHMAEIALWDTDLAVSDLYDLAQGANPLSIGPRGYLTSYYPLRGDVADYGLAKIGLQDLGTAGYARNYIDHAPVAPMPRAQTFFTFPAAPNAASGGGSTGPGAGGGTASANDVASGIGLIGTGQASASASEANPATGGGLISTVGRAGITASAIDAAMAIGAIGPMATLASATIGYAAVGLGQMGPMAAAAVATFGDNAASNSGRPFFLATSALAAGIDAASGAGLLGAMSAIGGGTGNDTGSGVGQFGAAQASGAAAPSPILATGAGLIGTPFAVATAGELDPAGTISLIGPMVASATATQSIVASGVGLFPAVGGAGIAQSGFFASGVGLLAGESASATATAIDSASVVGLAGPTGGGGVVAPGVDNASASVSFSFAAAGATSQIFSFAGGGLFAPLATSSASALDLASGLAQIAGLSASIGAVPGPNAAAGGGLIAAESGGGTATSGNVVFAVGVVGAETASASVSALAQASATAQFVVQATVAAVNGADLASGIGLMGALGATGTAATQGAAAGAGQIGPVSAAGVAQLPNLVANGVGLFAPVFTGCNYIANGSGTGAAMGTPGTLPSGWSDNLAFGLSHQVLGAGVENSIAYVDLRFFGTASGDSSLTFDTVGAGVVPGQAWTLSLFAKQIGGSTVNLNQLEAVLYGLPSTADYAGVPMLPLSNAGLGSQRFSATRLFSQPGTNNASSQLSFSTDGAVDFSLRIGGVQLEPGNSASALTQTTGRQVPRQALGVAVAGPDVATGQGLFNLLASGAGMVFGSGAVAGVFGPLSSSGFATEVNPVSGTGLRALQATVTATIEPNAASGSGLVGACSGGGTAALGVNPATVALGPIGPLAGGALVAAVDLSSSVALFGAAIGGGLAAAGNAAGGSGLVAGEFGGGTATANATASGGGSLGQVFGAGVSLEAAYAAGFGQIAAMSSAGFAFANANLAGGAGTSGPLTGAGAAMGSDPASGSGAGGPLVGDGAAFVAIVATGLATIGPVSAGAIASGLDLASGAGLVGLTASATVSERDMADATATFALSASAVASAFEAAIGGGVVAVSASGQASAGITGTVVALFGAEQAAAIIAALDAASGGGLCGALSGGCSAVRTNPVAVVGLYATFDTVLAVNPAYVYSGERTITVPADPRLISISADIVRTAS